VFSKLFLHFLYCPALCARAHQPVSLDSLVFRVGVFYAVSRLPNLSCQSSSSPSTHFGFERKREREKERERERKREKEREREREREREKQDRLSFLPGQFRASEACWPAVLCCRCPISNRPQKRPQRQTGKQRKRERERETHNEKLEHKKESFILELLLNTNTKGSFSVSTSVMCMQLSEVQRILDRGRLRPHRLSYSEEQALPPNLDIVQFSLDPDAKSSFKICK
jgi:hypothetical protein